MNCAGTAGPSAARPLSRITIKPNLIKTIEKNQKIGYNMIENKV